MGGTIIFSLHALFRELRLRPARQAAISMSSLRDLRALGDVESPDELLNSLVRFAHELDFGVITALLAVERPHPVSVPLSNFPPGYEEVFRDVPSSQRDPVFQALFRAHTPVMWDKSTYVEADAADLWDVQAPFGLHTGVAVALHLPNSRHFILGLDREKALPTSDTKLARLLGDIQLFAVHAQEAAVRLLTPFAQPPKAVSLTPGEIEVLRWVMLGKDTAAIAQILGISARTVKFHTANASEKLGAETRHGAVLRAIEYGLLPPP